MFWGNHRHLWLARSAIIAVGILGVLAVFAYAHYGSLEAALANLRGEPLVVVPAEIALGTGKKNDRHTVQFEIENFGRETATIVGAKCDCSCAIVSGLPLEVPSRKKGHLEANVSFPDTAGEFSHLVVFYTNVAQQGVLAAKIRGVVK